MEDLVEIVVSAEENGDTSYIHAWNHHNGSILKSYKSGSHAARTLCVLKQPEPYYILSAQTNKPFIHAWTIQGNGQVNTKMVTPGRVSALCITPNGEYCMGGIEEKLLLWHVRTGNLVAVIAYHFQKITCIRSSMDSNYFISGAEDNHVNVWALASILADDVTIVDSSASNLTPLYAWSHHTAPVTDIHVGLGTVHAKIATCSLDQSCKLYELKTGELLLSVTFPDGLTAMIIDAVEFHMIVGGMKGKMYLIKLYPPPRSLEHRFLSEEKPRTFEGHSKRVTSMAVSHDALMLLSGSVDTTVRLWHIGSGQCIRTFNHGGPVTNVQFVHAFDTFFTTEPMIPKVILQAFKRSLVWDSNTPRTKQKYQDIPTWLIDRDDEKESNSKSSPKWSQIKQDDEAVDREALTKQLHEANKKMYDYILEHILKKTE